MTTHTPIGDYDRFRPRGWKWVLGIAAACIGTAALAVAVMSFATWQPRQEAALKKEHQARKRVEALIPELEAKVDDAQARANALYEALAQASVLVPKIAASPPPTAPPAIAPAAAQPAPPSQPAPAAPVLPPVAVPAPFTPVPEPPDACDTAPILCFIPQLSGVTK